MQPPAARHRHSRANWHGPFHENCRQGIGDIMPELARVLVPLHSGEPLDEVACLDELPGGPVADVGAASEFQPEGAQVVGIVDIERLLQDLTLDLDCGVSSEHDVCAAGEWRGAWPI